MKRRPGSADGVAREEAGVEGRTRRLCQRRWSRAPRPCRWRSPRRRPRARRRPPRPPADRGRRRRATCADQAELAGERRLEAVRQTVPVAPTSVEKRSGLEARLGKEIVRPVATVEVPGHGARSHGVVDEPRRAEPPQDEVRRRSRRARSAPSVLAAPRGAIAILQSELMGWGRIPVRRNRASPPNRASQAAGLGRRPVIHAEEGGSDRLAVRSSGMTASPWIERPSAATSGRRPSGGAISTASRKRLEAASARPLRVLLGLSGRVGIDSVLAVRRAEGLPLFR